MSEMFDATDVDVASKIYEQMIADGASPDVDYVVLRRVHSDEDSEHSLCQVLMKGSLMTCIKSVTGNAKEGVSDEVSIMELDIFADNIVQVEGAQQH